MVMLRTISVMFALSIYGILPALAQTDAPEGRSSAVQSPVQRGLGLRTLPGSSGQMRPSDISPPPTQPSISPQSRPAASAASPFNPEPVPVISTKEGENGYVRTVCQLANIPANSAATTLTKLFKAEGESLTEPIKNKVVIVPETMGNCLFVSGPPAAVGEVRRLLDAIDRPASIVRLQVQIAELTSDKDKKSAADSDAAKGKTADDESAKKTPEKTEEGSVMIAELSTLDNQTAHIQFGSMVGMITGSTSTTIGQTNTVTQANIGTIVQMTPRVASAGIVALELSVQDSRVGPMEEGTPITAVNGKIIRQPRIDNLMNQTTLRLQDGQPQTIAVVTSNGKTRQIAVTAHIVRPGATNAAEQK
jgi:Bacterial type II and III secretion system protein/Bacterial type II/III secretion system short domain